MSFLQLVRREMEGSLGRLVFVSAMGGLSTTAIIGAINAGAGAADKSEISLWAAGFFIVALLLFIQTQHFILITTTAEIGAIIHKMRVRLLDYVRRSELLPLETIGRAEIVSAITRFRSRHAPEAATSWQGRSAAAKPHGFVNRMMSESTAPKCDREPLSRSSRNIARNSGRTSSSLSPRGWTAA